MKNIKKLVLGLAIAIIVTIGFNVQAATIKEDASLFNEDVYIIGSTKFGSDYIITASRAAIAGANELLMQRDVYGNFNFDSNDIKTYYYCALDNTWSEIKENGSGLKELTSTEVEQLTRNLNLFFVNNKEKTFEIPFDGVIDENSLSVYGFGHKELEPINGKLFVPASWFNGFTFTSNGINIEMILGSIDNNGQIIENTTPKITKDPEFVLTLPDKIYAGKEFEFTVQIIPNSFEGKAFSFGAEGISYLDDSLIAVQKVEYFDEETNSWIEGSILNPLSEITNKTIKYRTTVNYVGNYNIYFSCGGDFRVSVTKNFKALLHEDDVALVGTTYYTDLNAAINAASNGDTVKLLKDVTITDEHLVIDNNVILDLNGKTITFSDDKMIGVIGSADFTIANGSVVAPGDYAIQVQDDATLNILSDANITAGSYGITVWDNAIVNSKGNITVTGAGYGITGNGGYPQNTQINIIGGSITAVNGSALYLPQTGTTNISGGILTGNNVIGIKAGILNITGGELIATGDKKDPVIVSNGFNYTGDVIYIEENPDYRDNISIDITGGTLTSTNGYIIQEINPTLGTTNELTATITGLYANKNLITGTTNRFFYN